MLLARARQSLMATVSFRSLSQQARSIHIPRRIATPSASPNLLRLTRRFFNLLVTYVHGKGVPVPRSIRLWPSIPQSFSLPVRVALSRPLHAPCLPRAPHVPGHVAQVGLGFARSFSMGRPIFQHIVESVPPAFHGADWRSKMYKEKISEDFKKKGRKIKLSDKLAPIPELIGTANTDIGDEVQHYFQTPSSPLVITYLQIPLAPTPTSRVPLSPSPHLLPLSALNREHVSHSRHGIRVSSLFRRLDVARVWERGATCETYGDPSGLCTILRVRFEGWPEQTVKELLGDAGKGWCTVQELRTPPSLNSASQGSLSSQATTPASTQSSLSVEDRLSPSISFVMPTLDFSSSFMSVMSSPPMSPTRPSSPSSISDVESDYSYPSIPGSVWGEDNASNTSSISISLSGTGNEWSSPAVGSFPDPGWPSFSSDFVTRASHHGGE